MWCMKCQKHLSECSCTDLEDRLNSAVGKGSFVYKYCITCGKHYERCKCSNPIWRIKNKGEKHEQN